MLNFISSFHTSAPLMALRNHRLFPKVDWERIEAGNYAVVDPVNPGVILYLSEQDYIVMVRVAITSNRTLKVLAVPGDSPSVSPSSDSSTDPSQNSPSHINNINVPFMAGTVSGTERRRLQTLFSSPLQPFLQKVRERVGGKSVMVKTSMVQLFSRNARAWFNQWYNLLSWWTRGTRNSTVAMTERNTFGLWVVHILKHNGASHLITRFKIMLFVLNSFLSGKKLQSTQNLGFRIRLSNGLPTRIPRIAREYIRIGHVRYIHIWTSCLFAYKGLLGEWMEPNQEKPRLTREIPKPEKGGEGKEGPPSFSFPWWQAL
jgi:hypothetical protein